MAEQISISYATFVLAFNSTTQLVSYSTPVLIEYFLVRFGLFLILIK